MILLNGWIDVDPERRDEAIEAGKPHMQATRAQQGCLDYVWSGDPLVPGRIYVYERWSDAASLEAHFAGPHYLAMRDTIGGFGIRGMDVFKLEPAKTGAVYDPKGQPRADFFEA